ncbi:sigma-54-dependent transcriptional regulator [Methylorubrum extorquens]|jgi:DNA-binding NtrC family response regulator|uniref:Two component, sigma54 specific, transcriptional regulator, Fis family n=1 Tax=Methylorubrum extorquens DSM 13060 TaxID=882800 RepID=H1KGE3_METEX|nr:sigma-54 dependent transcriptional regulator [Methylorubrum extorquens]EHP93401.1 two component, sigma54 specific, transcriptional regulator, Fis family [Methylorubrum extorquens DSM 13060]
MTDGPGANDASAATSDPWLVKAHILVVDDEPGMRNFLVRTLAPRCARVEAVGDTVAAGRLIEASSFDLIILDNILGGRTGLSWLADLRRDGLFTEVILITAFADLETAIEAVRAGAADFVLKPFRTKQILNAVMRCLDRSALRRENFVLRRQLSPPALSQSMDRIVGTSVQMVRIRDLVARAAATRSTVLVTGESGTAKEVTARALHEQSAFSDRPFVPVNCGAIATDIIESELFGHVKGAFTSAASSREGLFFYAQGGTLFLDEIAELPLALQAKLLRVIEDRKVRPVGSDREIPVDVRLIAATNADLTERVATGQFRADLYYRLDVVRIHLPPLRERVEDIEPLARMFMDQLSLQLGLPPLSIPPSVLQCFEAYAWPGNARELRNRIERALILGTFGEPVAGVPAERRTDDLADVVKRHILRVLAASDGNRAEAARRLGVSRKTLDRKCVEWNA